tara:strand:+ start:412 stop:549 length:138 start_codon:yes stop_codon:yes gene_type:complete
MKKQDEVKSNEEVKGEESTGLGAFMGLISLGVTLYVIYVSISALT